MNKQTDDFDEIDDWCDYPYIGIGQKNISFKKKTPTEYDLERIIGG